MADQDIPYLIPDAIASLIDVEGLNSLADSVANDALQAVQSVFKRRQIRGGLRDSSKLRVEVRAIVLANIAGHIIDHIGALLPKTEAK